MTMNKNQRLMLQIAGITTLCLLLYPPMLGYAGNEAKLYVPWGHAWFWQNKLDVHVGVNWPVLLTYLLGLVIATGFGWAAAGKPQKIPE